MHFTNMRKRHWMPIVRGDRGPQTDLECIFALACGLGPPDQQLVGPAASRASGRGMVVPFHSTADAPDADSDDIFGNALGELSCESNSGAGTATRSIAAVAPKKKPRRQLASASALLSLMTSIPAEASAQSVEADNAMVGASPEPAGWPAPFDVGDPVVTSRVLERGLLHRRGRITTVDAISTGTTTAPLFSFGITYDDGHVEADDAETDVQAAPRPPRRRGR